MKTKQTELLNYLYSRNASQKCNEIAKFLNVSERSVKSYVSQINKTYNKKIILSSKNGYCINRQIFSILLLDESTEEIPQTDEKRGFYIIKQLILNQNDCLSLFDLCDYLCISYSTIKSVIAKMNKNYVAYDIKFLCDNDFVKVVGSEKNQRKLIRYVLNEDSNNSFIDLYQLQECFPEINIEKLRSIVIKTFKAHNYYLNDFSAINLLLHFLILIDRKIKGNHLNSGISEFEIEYETEYLLIQDLCQQFENEFHFSLNQYEKYEIYMLFKTNANYTMPSTRLELRQLVGDEIFNLCDYYVTAINNHYMIDLNNEAFLTPFSLHLKNLLFRAKRKEYTPNPMSTSVRQNNPIIYDIAIFVGLDLMERYNIEINQDELAFLAIHIGSEIERQNLNYDKSPAILICPDYRDMCENLLNRLLLNFGNQIHIQNVIHNESELETISFQYAVIFTTIPLSNIYDNTIIQLSPFDLNNQFEKIQDLLIKHKTIFNNNYLKTNFNTFFEEDCFIINPNTQNKNQILPYLCDMLRVKNYVNDSFEEQVYRRENVATTAFENIAIPHSMEMNAIKTSIAVAISKKGFQWENNTVHLVLLLAINKADKKRFRNIYESLLDIFNDKTILNEVRNCTSFYEFKQLIYSHKNSNI